MTKGRAIVYSREQLEWLETNCSLVAPELTRRFNERFGRDISQDNLRNCCQRNGWMTGRTGCFPKGSIPPNKGRKGWHPPGCEKSWFRKGQRSTNYRGPGHEYPDTKDGYVWLIVEGPSPYKSSTSKKCHAVMKHRHLWEQANGPIPKGHVLKCMDGDKTNCDPSNWIAIPQALLPRLAGGNRYRDLLPFDEAPAELKPLILAAAKLEHEAAVARRRTGRLTAGERYRERRRRKAGAE